MKTLVVHPEDRSTSFMRDAYRQHEYDVLTKSACGARPVLREYGRVIMIGHGTPGGLLSVGKFPGMFAVGRDCVAALRGKSNVYIWCWADMFVEAWGLNGFATGMFISEPREAYFHGISASDKEIEDSNRLFAEVMSCCMPNPTLRRVTRDYNGSSNVIKYNRAQMRQF